MGSEGRFGLLFYVFIGIFVVASCCVASGLLRRLRSNSLQMPLIHVYSDSLSNDEISNFIDVPTSWLNSLVIFRPAQTKNSLLGATINLHLFDPRAVSDYSTISIFNNTSQSIRISCDDTANVLPSFYSDFTLVKTVPPNTGITVQTTIQFFNRPNGWFPFGQYVQSVTELHARMWTFFGYFNFNKNPLPPYNIEQQQLRYDHLSLQEVLVIPSGATQSNIGRLAVPEGCEITRFQISPSFVQTTPVSIAAGTKAFIQFSENADMSNPGYSGTPPANCTSATGFTDISGIIVGGTIVYDVLNGNTIVLDVEDGCSNFQRFFNWVINPANQIFYTRVYFQEADGDPYIVPGRVTLQCTYEIYDATQNGTANLEDFSWFL